MRRTLTLAITGIAALSTLVAAPLAASSPASLPTIRVTITSSGCHITAPPRLTAGRVRFVLHTASSTGTDGGEFDVLRFVHGYTPSQYVADESYYYAHGGGSYRPTKKALHALRRADAHTRYLGGLGIAGGQTQVATLVLPRGRYFITNSVDPSQFTRIVAHGSTVARRSPISQATVTARAGDRFGGATRLPRAGTITFTNRSAKTNHVLELRQIKSGTSHRTVARRYGDLNNERSGRQPSWFRSGNVVSGEIGAGRSQTLSYSLPAGEYLELCYVPDDRTGDEHAYMGMWRIVHLY